MRSRRAILLLVGLVGACWSFQALSGASLPYPDPDPRMLEQQSREIRFWTISLLASVVLLAIGGWGSLRSGRND